MKQWMYFMSLGLFPALPAAAQEPVIDPGSLEPGSYLLVEPMRYFEGEATFRVSQGILVICLLPDPWGDRGVISAGSLALVQGTYGLTTELPTLILMPMVNDSVAYGALLSREGTLVITRSDVREINGWFQASMRGSRNIPGLDRMRQSEARVEGVFSAVPGPCEWS